MKMFSFLKFVLLASSIMLASLGAARAEEAKILRNISVSGHGESRAAPNLAQVQLGIFATAKSAREALAINTKSMKQLSDALKASGISDRDMQTSNFAVNPRLVYARDGEAVPPKVDGYEVTNSLSVTVRNLDKLGAILDEAVGNGSNQINGISFGIEDDTSIVDQARKLAVADARRKAELYATASGVKLGKVISISEGSAYAPPSPVVFSRAKAEMVSADVPIAKGEQVLGADVNVVWELE